MTRRRICVATGTRADYGLLYWLLRDLQAHSDLELQVVASAMHLAPAFGNTIDVIRGDGFDVAAAVSCLGDDDSDAGLGKAFGRAASGFSEAFNRLNPQLLVVLGDRFEALAAASAATIMHVPIAHLHGGEITLGAIDEAFRHAITKMSHLHFTAASAYRDRVVQMGEAPSRVFNVGALGLDNFSRLDLPSASAVLAELELPERAPFLLVTHHPATQEPGDTLTDIEALAAGLDALPDHTIIFTKANADPGGRAVNARLEEIVRAHPDRMRLVSSLGQKRYLAAMKGAAAVVGNSSSGIIEAPAADVPTVNIGRRQEGRLRALSVIDVAADPRAIADALRHATEPAFLTRIRADTPPYGRTGTATAQILSVLERTRFDRLLPKPFNDLATEGHRVA